MFSPTSLTARLAPTVSHPYFLWHLAALNVIDVDFTAPGAPAVLSTVWDRILANAAVPAAEAKIALIDTGVSRLHPNLATRVIAADSIDLVTHRFGASYVLPGAGPSAETKRAFFAELDLAELGPLGLSAFETEYLEEYAAALRSSQGAVRHVIDNDELFAAHGTSCAGLMVGEPALAGSSSSGLPGPGAVLEAGAALNGDPAVLPYFGVDPFSRIISIRTGFEADADQFIAALLYAWMKRADVIVLPRGIPDPELSRLPVMDYLSASLESYHNAEVADLFARLNVAGTDPDPKAPETGFLPRRRWEVLRALMLAIGRKIPIICAAGNDGESQPIYPASLAGAGNGIIAVGAITAEGYRSGYSNYGNLTLVAPSDDGEVLNCHQIRQPRPAPAEKDQTFAAEISAPGEVKIPYAELALITSDLPGAFGYAGEGQRAVNSSAERQGLYTKFGGTSGASALIGGLAALVQRARRAAGLPALDGLALKTVLTEASALDRPVKPGTRIPTPDPMNTAIEVHEDLSHFFGAGLPDAGIAVSLALSMPA